MPEKQPNEPKLSAAAEAILGRDRPSYKSEAFSLTSRLIRARSLRGLSQAQLGAAIDKPQAVSDWETGKYKPGFDSIRAICRVLRIRPDFLFGFENSVFAARVPGESI